MSTLSPLTTPVTYLSVPFECACDTGSCVYLDAG